MRNSKTITLKIATKFDTILLACVYDLQYAFCSLHFNHVSCVMIKILIFFWVPKKGQIKKKVCPLKIFGYNVIWIKKNLTTEDVHQM